MALLATGFAINPITHTNFFHTPDLLHWSMPTREVLGIGGATIGTLAAFGAAHSVSRSVQTGNMLDALDEYRQK